MESIFRPSCYCHDAALAVQLRVSIGICRLAQLSATYLVEPDRPEPFWRSALSADSVGR
jgi:hypothetical protein